MNYFKVSANIFLVVVIMSMWTSCESVRDTYKDFLGDGERVYVGKIDSLRIFSGYERVQVWGLLNYARTAKEVVVEWDDKRVVHSLDGYDKSDILTIDIDNLNEGARNFNIYTKDGENNTSISTTIFAEIYGPLYLQTLSPRSIAAIAATPEKSLRIDWNAAETNVVDVTLEYKDNEGELKSLTIDNSAKVTMIESWKPSSKVRVITRVLPKETDLDVLELAPVEYTLPMMENQVNTSDFVRVADTGAASETGYGGKEKGLFDNDESTIIHTHDGVGVPNHISYDMGGLKTLSKGKLVVRYNEPGDGWSPAEFELWGLKDYGEDQTADFIPNTYPDIADNFDTKLQWPLTAESKGWVKIASVKYSHASNQGAVEFPIDSSVPVRYIMYRVTKVCDQGDGFGVYSCAKELYLWEKE